MAILNTATGTVAGDVAQIRTAIYGREVRASIAEAIELLDSSVNGDGEDSLKSRIAALQAELEALRKEAESVPDLQERLQAAEAKLTALQEDIKTLQNHAHNIDAGFVPMFEAGHSGLNWTVYRWADGTTTFDRIRENPALAGTEIILGNARYRYANAVVGEDGVVPVFCGRLEFQGIVDGTEDGVVNERGHHLPCGYFITESTSGDEELVLYDADENRIAADADGDLEQCAVLYGEDNTVKGFRVGKDKKVYLSDMLRRLDTLEANQ